MTLKYIFIKHNKVHLEFPRGFIDRKKRTEVCGALLFITSLWIHTGARGTEKEAHTTWYFPNAEHHARN